MKKAEIWDGLDGAKPVIPTGVLGRKILKVGIAQDSPRPKGCSLDVTGNLSATPRRRKANGQWNGTVTGWKYRETPETPWGITKGEAEVLTWMVELSSRKEVLLAMGITERTYDFHIFNVRKKLGVKTATAAFLKWAYWVWSTDEGNALRVRILGVGDDDARGPDQS